MFRLGHFAFTIIRVSGQEIENLPQDGDIFTIRKTHRGKNNARPHERYAKVQNWMRGHFLSSGTPSSARNVDGARPANMLEDLPGKKSQLDLKPFGVGVPAAGVRYCLDHGCMQRQVRCPCW